MKNEGEVFAGTPCRHVKYATEGGVHISPNGDVWPVFPDEGVPCNLMADPGKDYCPLHELERKVNADAA